MESVDKRVCSIEDEEVDWLDLLVKVGGYLCKREECREEEWIFEAVEVSADVGECEVWLGECRLVEWWEFEKQRPILDPDGFVAGYSQIHAWSEGSSALCV